MESPEIKGWLPDVNVWLALCSDRHEHNNAEVNWMAAVREPMYFCRVTQMSLFRLLTNTRVMGADTLTPQHAISVYRALLADERVRFAPEPADAERLWLSLMTSTAASGSVWTDAWLAAFALAHGSRLVSFDGGMRRWPTLDPDVLRGN
jgi:toxin-antitoxin system PIN domain toxin